jgi:hypothetical protein
MKEARWDDTFADDIDEDSDDDFGDSKQTLLSADDPRLLENVTQEALGDTLQNLGKSMSKIAQSATNDGKDSSVRKAIFILRVVREFGDRIPRLRLQERSSPLPSPFTSDVLEPLHTTLAAHVSQLTLSPYEASLVSSTKSNTQTHVLWEGHPPLPSQPSPSAFRFLQELNKVMARLGSDLWAPAGVAVIKSKMSVDVIRLLEQHIETIKDSKPLKDTKAVAQGDEPKEVDGKEEDTDANTADAPASGQENELTERRLKQLLFDALYLQRFFSSDTNSTQATDALTKKIGIADLNDAAIQRLRKNAAEYAKKTYLLFALLA